MIDHIIAFTDESTAKLDSVVGKYFITDSDGAFWRGDVCIPNLQIIVISTGLLYDNLWRINIALPTQNAALSANSGCELVADRDAANADQPFILQAQLTDQQLAALEVSPVFAGSNYPFGSPD